MSHRLKSAVVVPDHSSARSPSEDRTAHLLEESPPPAKKSRPTQREKPVAKPDRPSKSDQPASLDRSAKLAKESTRRQRSVEPSSRAVAPDAETVARSIHRRDRSPKARPDSLAVRSTCPEQIVTTRPIETSAFIKSRFSCPRCAAPLSITSQPPELRLIREQPLPAPIRRHLTTPPPISPSSEA